MALRLYHGFPYHSPFTTPPRLPLDQGVEKVQRRTAFPRRLAQIALGLWLGSCRFRFMIWDQTLNPESWNLSPKT